MALPQEHLFSEREWAELTTDLRMSRRENEIAHCILGGMSDRQISQQLGIPVPTVRTHLGRLFNKLSVDDRHELILYFLHKFRNDQQTGDHPTV